LYRRIPLEFYGFIEITYSDPISFRL
jgi:hypothetical protein